MIRSSENSPGSRFSKSLLWEYRQEMLRRKDLVKDAESKEEIQQLIELSEDLDLLFEHG